MADDSVIPFLNPAVRRRNAPKVTVEIYADRLPGLDSLDADGWERVRLVLGEIVMERDRQQTKWGEQNLDPFAYGAVLTEEVGEAMKAALHARFGGPDAENLRAELVQVAAVAVAFIECLDRGKWAWGGHAQTPCVVCEGSGTIECNSDHGAGYPNPCGESQKCRACDGKGSK